MKFCCRIYNFTSCVIINAELRKAYFKILILFKYEFAKVQGDFESCADILITSYWLDVELEKNVSKILCQKIK
jgi:hypothetical protein